MVHTQADLRSDTARRALGDVDVLYHLGFALWRRADATRVNRDATRNILGARPARIVLASSAAVYGAWPDNPLPLTEDHWPQPNRQCAYAGDKLRAERLCADAAPTIALRIAAVLGAHTDPLVAHAVRGYRHLVPAFSGEKEALQFLDEDDAAGALHRAGPSSFTGIINVATTDWLDASAIAAVAGSRVLRLPGPVLLAASEASFGLHLTPFGADRAILIRGPLALSPSRAASVLGWTASQTSASVLARFVARL